MPVDRRFTKKIGSKVRSSAFRWKLKLFFLTIFVVFMTISFFWGEFGFIRMWILTKRIDILKQEIQVLQVQRQDILWEIDKMKNDPEYLKSYAIRRYGYAEPGQRVIQFVPVDSARTISLKK
jgi:cell division protein FtsB